MPYSKGKLAVRHGEKRKERNAESIEQALRDVLRDVKKGDVELPFVLEFDGPKGTKFNIAIETVDAAQEITTMGFMF